MNIMIIPDLHGRKFWRQAIANNIDKVNKVIFLGDYLDPYNDPNLEDDPIEMLQDIINLKKNNPDKYTLLLGNHSIHYIWYNFPKSSRYDRFREKDYYNIFYNNLNLFNIAFVQDDVIFTHAGITNKWKEMCFPELTTLEVGKKLASEKLTENGINFGYLAAISFYRGGTYESGSCEWADVIEHLDSTGNPTKYENCYQVFGHTRVSKPVITDTWACLDCQKGFIIDTISHEISEC